jgi:hypothetical protein
VDASANNRWGNSGANGGNVILTADRQTFSGDMTADEISTITATLQNGSALTGAINTAHTAKAVNLTLYASSTWNVTADSMLTCLADAIEAAESVAHSETCGPRILSSCLAYREWAIAHPVDFQLIYGNPIPGYVAPADITVPLARRPFDGLFRLFLEAYQTGELVVPAEYAPVPVSITAHVAVWLPKAGYNFPDALLCLLMSGWARIHGMVMLELFEHLGPVVGDAAAFYRYELGAFLQRLGIALPNEGHAND